MVAHTPSRFTFPSGHLAIALIAGVQLQVDDLVKADVPGTSGWICLADDPAVALVFGRVRHNATPNVHNKML